jgi:hypothetical protein
MPSNARLSKERIGDLPSLGRDAEGGRHHIDPLTQTVYVLDDGLAHVEDLSDRPVADWMDYVDRERGWATCRYERDPDGLASWLADAVEGSA